MWFDGLGFSSNIINLINNILNKILNIGSDTFDPISMGLSYVLNFFNLIGKYVRWFISYTGLMPEFAYVILSLVGAGFGIIISTFTIKLIARWWSILAP